ncbi:unnamed protein product [Ambrosiozyma monospora]|uniref:Unnamed protein product n=1 Tax=Ambrosiozyma monospora TaxID=43982 RepID=A0A9W6Z5J5_AMBMO|nr:unnamed protein product [Ambrosiozyma monospora]
MDCLDRVADLAHENQPPGVTHLHLDAIPDVEGETYWVSGYAAYDELSEEVKKFLDVNADIQVRFKWGPTNPGYGVSAHCGITELLFKERFGIMKAKNQDDKTSGTRE